MKVLNEFVKNPKKPYQIRELSRNIKLAATSVRIYIKQLEKDNLIRQERVGVYNAYKANFDNENFRFYKWILNLVNLKQSGLIGEIEKKTTPDAVVLFGSFAKGEDTENSDVDIFILAKEKSIELKEYEKRLARKIHLFFSEDLNKLPVELQNNILNGIVLSGFMRWKI